MARVAFVNEEIEPAKPAVNEERAILNLSVQEALAVQAHLSQPTASPIGADCDRLCGGVWRALKSQFEKRWLAEIERKRVERMAEGDADKPATRNQCGTFNLFGK